MKGHFADKLVLFFGSTDEDTGSIEQQIILHVTLDPELSVIKFDVDLHSLPEVYLNGYEVVAIWSSPDIKNDGIFYTDSNGLEMQNRTLNYRSYYNISDKMYSNNP
jgi:hypothetical protein